MVIALMDPVTAIALTFFPYCLADLKRFVFLSTTTEIHQLPAHLKNKPLDPLP
jgi:hypothetical protein